MGHLGVPRLHFAGTLLARPSTVNNDITNYNPATSPIDPGPCAGMPSSLPRWPARF
jgi:hypothetical protein